jgi:serine/threonine protein phosphatase PrpC
MGLKDSLLKFLRQDDAPDPEPQKPESQPAPGAEAVVAPQAVAAREHAGAPPPQVATTAPEGQPQPAGGEAATAETMPLHLEVSPPGHAPQGLAAETDQPPGTATAAAGAGPAQAAGAATTNFAAQESGDIARDMTTAASTDTAAQESRDTAAPTMAAAATAGDAPADVAAPVTPPTAAPAEGATSEGAPATSTDAAATAPGHAEAVEPAATAPDAGLPAPDAGTGTVEPPASAPAAEVEGAATAAAESAEVAPASAAPLAPDTVVGERYVIVRLMDDADSSGDILTYQARDRRSYEQCWSCGQANDDPSVRFCHKCGAPIQDHPVTLVQTRTATGEPGEIEQDGSYFHPQPDRRMFGAEGVGLEIGACSAEGPHHPNEDSYWYATRTLCANSRRQTLAVVVFGDGMGGYAPGSGLISSRVVSMTGQQILTALDDQAETLGELDAKQAETVVRAAIAAANTMVLDEIARSGEMGATLVTVLIHDSTAYVANIGDSRAYYIDPRGRSTAITRDQSLVAQQVLHGYIAESDIYSAPGNNIILHAVGEPRVEEAADWYSQELEPGSYVLICSDGYWKTLRGEVMPPNLLHEQDNLTGVARSMVDAALSQGSDDNTTVILIAIT